MSQAANGPTRRKSPSATAHTSGYAKNGRAEPAQDIHLIFPPQWSPFQPFLSTPALKAYLEKKGYSVSQSDWNVDFYDYFISPERLQTAIFRLQTYAHTLSSDYDNYRNQVLVSLGILSDYHRKHKLVSQLKTEACLSSVEDFHQCVTAFKRLLHAFSVAEPVVEVGTSSLQTGNTLQSIASVDRFCCDAHLNPFHDFMAAKVAQISEKPRYFGLSVIGTEQVLAALTLSKALKARFPDVPVLVGGSVFSRLVDKGEAIKHMFDQYFDYVIRYEGESPMDEFLGSSDPRSERTGNLCFADGDTIVKTPLVAQLGMPDIPAPDFDGLDLSNYYTPEIVLPVLSTRGCYWDKCAFCYHGMIYGDRYRMRSPEMFRDDIEHLHDTYGARHFALNDEAIPPKLFDKLPKVLKPQTYYFTGLYKFEKYFTPAHYQGMYDIGFRSLYIGLESASERVQRHMKKDNTRDVMISNLQDGHDAGIWNHTFNFFGFPTETHDEAMETADFLIEHADIIHSEGTGTFSFEHNAPIAQDPAYYGASNVTEKPGSVLELYYDYDVVSGMTADEALDMVGTFSQMKIDNGAYQYSGWIPREHLLVLLSRFERDGLRERLEQLDAKLQNGQWWQENLCWFTMSDATGKERHYVVNVQAGKILETNRDAVVVLEFIPQDLSASAIVEHFPVFEQVIRT